MLIVINLIVNVLKVHMMCTVGGRGDEVGASAYTTSQIYSENLSQSMY